MLATQEFERVRSARNIPPTQGTRWVERPQRSKMKDDYPFGGGFVAGYYTPPFTQGFLSQIKGTAWACLNLNGNQIANLKWRAMKVQKDGSLKELPREHWLSQFLLCPTHPYFSRTPGEAWKLIDQWLSVTGHAYNLMQMDKQTGMPKYMWQLETNNVLTAPSEENESLPQYIYTTPRGRFTYRHDEVFFTRISVPTQWFIWNMFFGIPEYSFYADVMQTEMSALLSQDSYFQNGAAPGLLFETPSDSKGVNDGGAGFKKQVSQFTQQYDETHRGPRNSGRPLVAPGGWEVKMIDDGKREVNFLQTIETLRKYIATCAGVPLTVLDGEYGGTWTAAETIIRGWHQNRTMPRAKLIAESLTRYMQMFEENVCVTFDDIVQEPFEMTMEKVKIMAETPGAGNGNDARRLLKLGDPIPEGETFFAGRGVATLDQIIGGLTAQTNAPANLQPNEKENPNKQKGKDETGD